MIRTVARQTVDNGTVVAWAEGVAIGAATWTPSIWMEIDDAVLGLPLINITTKTVNGFTLTGLLQAVEIYGIVSDAGELDSEDPDLQFNAIVSLAQLKAYLNLEDSDTLHDAFLRTCINRISDDIEATVRSKVQLQSVTGLVLDGTGTDKLYLPSVGRPIIQIGTAAAADEPDLQYRDTLISGWVDLFPSGEITSAILNPTEPYYIVLYNTTFPEGFQNIKLNLKAGYVSIPGGIVKVCIEAVAEMFYESRRSDSRLGKTSVSGSMESRNQNTSYYQLSERHKAALMPYTWLA